MTFEELKQKLDTLKTKRDQCLGVIKNIEDGWGRKNMEQEMSMP